MIETYRNQSSPLIPSRLWRNPCRLWEGGISPVVLAIQGSIGPTAIRALAITFALSSRHWQRTAKANLGDSQKLISIDVGFNIFQLIPGGNHV